GGARNAECGLRNSEHSISDFRIFGFRISHFAFRVKSAARLPEPRRRDGTKTHEAGEPTSADTKVRAAARLAGLVDEKTRWKHARHVTDCVCFHRSLRSLR